VFTSFTLSQSGMVRHHQRLRERGWRRGVVINGVGAFASFVVLMIVAVTKFAVGAWLPILVVPMIIALFVSIKRHYTRLAQTLVVTPADVRPRPMNHTVVVLVSRVHRGVINALQYAQSLRPNHLVALHVSDDDADREEIEAQWTEFGFEIPLEIVHSPYRELTPAVERYLDELDSRWHDDTITVVIPEFVAGRLFSPTQLLHNQSAAALKVALLFRKNTVVTSVPWHVDDEPENGHEASDP
jgi:hypothetical protein